MFDFNLEFARGGAAVATELFELLAAGGVKQNIVFSPFSIQTCVALAFAGASGETADQIAEGLKFASNFHPEVATTFAFVFDKYKDSELLKIANKVYVQQGHDLKPDYQTELKESYNAETENVNFEESENVAATINSWVEDKTAGKIKDLVQASAFSALTRLVLLNALHFKGLWAHKFEEEQTVEDDFWISEEESVKVQYMNQKAKFGYGFFEELDCQALELPYQDSDLSMLVLLPNEREGLKTLAEKLKSVNLVDLAGNLEANEDVVVQLPKFKVEYEVELTETLKKLGISKIFSEEAEFSNMLESPEPLQVSNVFHKAVIEVNEEGTEAAAATAMIMMTRCLLIPLQFVADRPFFYAIWNKRNILFAGAFVNAP
ncbi:serine protease inhibitor 42Dd [Bactrocera neohumeralis]|uniref:serine protease inhibitor 42Dd n=1 Tax=Bactrocera tryoni TaxID=59916 RepID=UPI001A95EBD5|nr:serine protease inhibitor 42Dd [Bactrocera tryoni]XP_050327306.1 serine protease inhibitor 42Dd [Bactrocera neohumeralis]